MKILFVADPLESFKIYKDTTFAMMREAQKRGHQVVACQMTDVRWQRGEAVSAQVRHITLTGQPDTWFTETSSSRANLKDFGAVIMRTDPPFDSEYFYATHLLSQAEREGAKVFNSPAALRNHPEKLAILEFPQFIAPTLVTRSEADIRAFHAEHGDVIFKPLDGMGGSRIFRCRQDDPNVGVILETLTEFSQQLIMAQRYIPEIVKGDKRILIIDGEPVPYALARIPLAGETRGNLAAGGRGVAQPLSEHDWHIARTLGPVLAALHEGPQHPWDLPRMAQLGQHKPGMGHQHLTRLCGVDAAIGAVEQHHRQLRFEIGDGFADRRLRSPQCPGG